MRYKPRRMGRMAFLKLPHNDRTRGKRYHESSLLALFSMMLPL